MSSENNVHHNNSRRICRVNSSINKKKERVKGWSLVQPYYTRTFCCSNLGLYMTLIALMYVFRLHPLDLPRDFICATVFLTFLKTQLIFTLYFFRYLLHGMSVLNYFCLFQEQYLFCYDAIIEELEDLISDTQWRELIMVLFNFSLSGSSIGYWSKYSHLFGFVQLDFTCIFSSSSFPKLVF